MTDPLDPPERPDGAAQAEVDATRPRRRRLVLAAAALVVAAAVVATVVVITTGDGRPVPGGSMPTLGTQYAAPSVGAPTSRPGEPAAPPAYAGAPLWNVRLPGEENEYGAPTFAVSDHGFVVQNDKALLGLDRSGAEVWRFTPPEVDYYTVRVTGPQVLVGYASDEDRWPQPQVIVALDAANGKELWRETEASLWTATTDTAYLSVCHGGQNNRVGDCTLSARDPRTNTIRWRVQTYASSRVINDSGSIQAAPTPSRLLVAAYPTGADSLFISAHDPATGATLGSGYEGSDDRIGQIDVATERTVVTVDDDDDNPANGCSATISGFALSGAERWHHTARTAKEHDGKRCGRVPVSYHGGRMAFTATDGAPSVLNLDTGAVEWAAPPGGQAVAAAGTTLLVVDRPAEGADGELVAYRIGSGTPIWRVPFAGNYDHDPDLVTGDQVVFTGQEAVRFDLKTGKSWSYGGTVAQTGPTWFAVCATASCRAFATG
ncbi:outer membrane protein assembly factor BamB family protein [Actinophytocola sp. KF-1]